jgi:mRNA interferase RelE/StbE
MAFTIDISDAALKTLASYPLKVRRQIGRKIDKLAEDPRPASSIPLKGNTSLRRIRTGNYRIIYTVRDDKLLILVVGIGDRKDIYKRLSR